MIASRVEGIRQLPENRPSVVLDAGRLAVHKALGSHNLASKCHSQRLVAETDTEYRQASREMLDHLDGDASFIGGARSRGDDDAVGLQRLDLLHRYLVVPVDPDIFAQLPEVLDEVVGKGIVIIDHQQHGGFCRYSNPCSASSSAFIMARALLQVSSYSCSGFESATMPAPA